MAWHPALTDLQNALAELYNTQADAHTFVDTVGLNGARIAYDPEAINTWHSILGEAMKEDKVEAVMQAALTAYPNYAPLRDAAAACRRPAPEVVGDAGSTGMAGSDLGSAGSTRAVTFDLGNIGSTGEGLDIAGTVLAKVVEPGLGTLVTEPAKPARIFVSYRRGVDPDERLAQYLCALLSKQGHDVFVDRDLRTGDEWLEEIDRQIREADFLVVLLSKESAYSEMVRAEVRRAYNYRQENGRPRTLPVRIAWEGLLPYSIDAMIDPLQYILWTDEASSERVVHDILAVIEDRLPQQRPVQPQPAPCTALLSEDGRPIADAGAVHEPLPEFDPRCLQSLEAPGGAASLSDMMYIERDVDARFKALIVQPGQTIGLRAARQTGKSSLLVRGLKCARDQQMGIVYLDLQPLESNRFLSADMLLHDLGQLIVRKLRLDADLDKAWSGPQGPQIKLTSFLEDCVLPNLGGPIVLALDEADRLLTTPFYQDFFSMLRSWHNSRAVDEQWGQMSMVLAISSEPYLLIDDQQFSPFNVGTSLFLVDLNQSQVRELDRRHGMPVPEKQLPELMNLLDGHPYLTRRALYTLAVEKRMTWPELLRIAPTDQGPFGDHLRSQYWHLRNHPELLDALANIIRRNRCPDDMIFYRLLRAGLVKGSGDVCRCRCDLYAQYLRAKVR